MAAAVRRLPSAASYFCLLFLFLVVASPAALSQAPSWLDVERQLSVVQGHNASLRCTLQSDEAVSQVTWSFRPSQSDASVHVATKSQLFGSSVSTSYLDRATFTDPQDVSDGSLSVRSVSLSDEGVFTCDFTLFPSGSITGETQLQILVRPVVSLVPGSAHLVAGEPPLVAGLCRAANGKPAAVVTWSGLGQGPAPVVTETANADGTVSVVSELWVSPARALHGQPVVCTVAHPSLTRPETQSLTLSVMFAPEVTVSGFDGKWYLQRGDAQLTCHSVANPPADSFTWSRDNVSLSALGLDSDNASLRFPPLRQELSGDYSCLARNHVGSGHASVTVRVTERAVVGGVSAVGVAVGVAGGVALLLSVALLCACARRRRHRRAKAGSENDVYFDGFTTRLGPSVSRQVANQTPPCMVSRGQPHDVTAYLSTERPSGPPTHKPPPPPSRGEHDRFTVVYPKLSDDGGSSPASPSPYLDTVGAFGNAAGVGGAWAQA